MTNSIRCTIILYLHFLPPISQGYFFIDGGFYGVPFSLCKKGLFPYSSLFSILPCHFYLFLQTIVPPQCVIFTSSNVPVILAFGFVSLFPPPPPAPFLCVYISSTRQSGVSLFDNQLSLPQLPLPQHHALCISPLLVCLSVFLVSHTNLPPSLLLSYSAFACLLFFCQSPAIKSATSGTCSLCCDVCYCFCCFLGYF